MRILILILSLILLTNPVYAGASRFFDSVNDDVDIGDIAAYDFVSTDFSICTFVRVDDISDNFQFILTKADGNLANGGWENYYRDQGATTNWSYVSRKNPTGSSSVGLETATAPKANNWYFFVIVHKNSAQTIDLYIIDLESGAGTETTQATSQSNYPTANTLTTRIGSRGNDSGWFGGQLAYAMLFDRGLTADEVQELAYTPTSIVDTLVGSWMCLGESPEPDISTNSNNGTVTGSIASTLGPPVYFPTGGN